MKSITQELVNAFVDIRTTLTEESCLFMAIKNRYKELILFMWNEIWIANGSGHISALIFDRILNSKFDNKGQRILDALSLKNMIPVLTCLMGYNCVNT